MKADIEQALSRPVCSGWDRGFLESILSQLERGRQLSDKQIATVTKVVLRNSESDQAIHDQWASVFETEHKAEALVLANYYKTTGYFTELTRDILNDVVPDMRAYTKMSTNRYAQRVLETHRSTPKYSNGTLVACRSGTLRNNIRTDQQLPWAISTSTVEAFKKKGGFVICTTSEVRSAAKGAKIYKILPVGSAIPVFIEERHIKLKRK